MSREEDNRGHTGIRKQPIGLIRQIDQRHRRQCFDEPTRGGGACTAPTEELDGAQDQSESCLVGGELHRPKSEVKAFPARRMYPAPIAFITACRGGFLASIAPRRIAHDDIELSPGAPFGQRRLAVCRPLHVSYIADDERLADQRLEFQLTGWFRVRIEFQSRQVKAEGGNAHRSFADVHSVDLFVQRGPDQSAVRLDVSRTETNEPSQRFDQKDAGAARQIEYGFLAGQSIRDFVEDQGDERQSRVENIHFMMIAAGR